METGLANMSTGNVSLHEMLQKRISERIRSNFVELLPQEAFDKMVDVAMDEFIHGPRAKRFFHEATYPDGFNNPPVMVEKPRAPDRDGKLYNPVDDPDTLPGMIMAELRKTGREKLATIMQGPEFQVIWNGSEDVASETVKQMIGANAQMFVQAMFSGIVGRAVMEMGNNIRNGRPF